MKPSSGTTRTRCPGCAQTLRVTVEFVGKRVRCKACGNRFVVQSALFDPQQAAHTSLDIIETMDGATTGAQTVDSKNRKSKLQRNTKEELGTIGRFVLQGVLGQGGFGKVYAAHDPLLNRALALKIPRAVDGDTNHSRRFHTEARAAARLKHPNIVAVYESGEADGVSYLATELVEGETLTNWIRENPRDFRRAAIWIRALGEALSYAHEEGVIHRDIKSENILIAKNQRPMLMDFGLAKQMDQESSLTTDGSILGTPAYMSPEQARGETDQVGPLSDLYSLGAVLYELLTGQRPFDGPAHAVIARVVNEAPESPCALDPDIPRDLEAICLKAMAKQPQDRYPSVKDFASDLERWLDGDVTEARPVGLGEKTRRWYRDNRRVAIAFTIAAVSLVAVASLTTVAYFRESNLRATAVEQRRIAEEARSQEATARAEAEEATHIAESALQRERDAQQALNLAQERVVQATNVADEAQQREQDARNQTLARQAADRRLADEYLLRGRQKLASGDAHYASLWLAEALRILPPDSGTLDYEIRTELERCRQKSIPLEIMALSREFAVQPNGPLALINAFPPSATAVNREQRGTYRLLSMETGKLSAEMKHVERVSAAVFSADGTTLVTASNYYTNGSSSSEFDMASEIRRWQVAPLKLIEPVTRLRGSVSKLQLSPDATSLLVVANDHRVVDRRGVYGSGRVIVYDLPSLQMKTTLAHEGRVMQALWNISTGRVVTSQSKPDELIFWNTQTGSVIHKPSFDGNSLPTLATDASGQYVLGLTSGYPMGQLRIWTFDGQLMGNPISCFERSSGLNFGQTVACGVDPPVVAVIAGNNKDRIQIWQLETGKVSSTFQINAQPQSLCFLDQGRTLAVGTEVDAADGRGVGQIQKWDTERRKPIGQPIDVNYPVTHLGVNQEQAILASAGTIKHSNVEKTRHVIEVWDLALMARIGSPIVGKGYAADLRFNGPNRLVSEGFYTRIWSLPVDSRKSRWPLSADAKVHKFDTSADGETIAGVTFRTPTYWPPHSQAGLPVDSKLSLAHEIALSATGSHLVLRDDDEFELWNLQQITGPAALVRESVNGLSQIEFSPDQNLLRVDRRTARGQIGVQLFGVTDGKPVGSEMMMPNGLIQVSPNGRYLVCARNAFDPPDELRVFETSTGRQLHKKSMDSPRRIKAFRFSSDGDSIYVVWQGISDVVVEEIALETLSISTSSEPIRGRILDGPNAMNQLLISEGQTGARVWDIVAGQQIGQLIPRSHVSGTLSPDGKHAVLTTVNLGQEAGSGKTSTTTRGLFSFETAKQVVEIEDQFRDVQFAPDGSFLICEMRNATFTIWNTETGKIVGHKIPPESDYRCLTRGRILVTDGPTIQLLDLNNSQVLKTQRPVSGILEAIARRTGHVLLKENDRLTVVNLLTSRRDFCEPDMDSFTDYWLSADGSTVVIGNKRPNDQETTLRRWRVEEVAVDAETVKVPGKVWKLASDSSGSRLFIVADDDQHTVQCISYPEGTEFQKQLKFPSQVDTLACSPDDSSIAVALYNDTIEVHSLGQPEAAARRFSITGVQEILWVDNEQLAVLSKNHVSLIKIDSKEVKSAPLVGEREAPVSMKAWCGLSVDGQTLVIAEPKRLHLFSTSDLSRIGRIAITETEPVVAVTIDKGMTLFTKSSEIYDAPIKSHRLPNVMAGQAEIIQQQIERSTGLRLQSNGDLQVVPEKEWVESFYGELESVEAP